MPFPLPSLSIPAAAPWLLGGLLLAAAPARGQSGDDAPPVPAPATASAAFPAALPAEVPAAALSLPEALRRALDANPDLAAVRREWEATAGALAQAGLRRNPDIGWAEEDFRHGTRTRTLQLTQPLELGGKRQARIAVAERAREQAAVGIDQYRAELRAAVFAGFHEVLLARERLRLSREAADLAARGTDIAGRRVRAGKVAPVEETRAAVAQAAAQAELLRAEGALRAARQRLAALWGAPAEAYGELAGALALPAEDLPDAVVSRRMQDAPILQRARLEAQRWDAIVRLEQSRAVVDVAVTVAAKRLPGSGGTQAIVGIAVPFPVFDRNQGNIAEALSRQSKAQDEYRAAELRLASEVAQARETLRAARAEALTLQRDAVPGARAAWQAASEGFRLGKFSFLEALDAQRTLVSTQAQHLRALGDTCRAAIELERLLGAADAASDLLNVPTP